MKDLMHVVSMTNLGKDSVSDIWWKISVAKVFVEIFKLKGSSYFETPQHLFLIGRLGRYLME